LHAADVLQTCSIFLKWGKVAEVLKLSDLDCCSLLISTIIHDFKHPGKTNLFLINTGHSIAIQYNGNFSNILSVFLNRCICIGKLSLGGVVQDYKII
jgi:hypothetical protein